MSKSKRRTTSDEKLFDYLADYLGAHSYIALLEQEYDDIGTALIKISSYFHENKFSSSPAILDMVTAANMALALVNEMFYYIPRMVDADGNSDYKVFREEYKRGFKGIFEEHEIAILDAYLNIDTIINRAQNTLELLIQALPKGFEEETNILQEGYTTFEAMLKYIQQVEMETNISQIAEAALTR